MLKRCYAQNLEYLITLVYEELEDIKGIIQIHNSTKDRQHNGQMKNEKRINNNLQNIHRKLRIEQNEIIKTRG